MKMTTLLLLITVMTVSAASYAQKITLKEDKASLDIILRKIRIQSGYDFVYSDDILRVTTPVSLEVNNVSVEEALKQSLKNQPLIYHIEDRSVIIKVDEQKVETITRLINSNIDLRGRVTDEDGNPLLGATVTLKGNPAKTTLTNMQGEFVLPDIDPANEIIISYIGKISQTITAGTRQNIVIVLHAEAMGLNEVVVVGYGAQRKKDLTGAVSIVTSKDLEDRPATNFGYSLEGKAAGVEVQRPSGKPQAGVSIRVRGTTSITANSEPIYIVDGVQSATTYDINPTDIESITILKDASSSAIYGAAGANGVVLITTKRGKNQKPVLTLSAYGGVSNVLKKLDVLDRGQYIDLMTELNEVADWTKYKANTNWQDVIFRDAYAQNYQLSLNGGSDNTQYYISGGWIKEDGVVRNNSVNRYNFKVNLDQKVGKIVKVGTSVLFSRWFDRNIDDNKGSGRGGVIMNLLTSSPVIDIFNPDGSFTANPLRLSFNNPAAYTDGAVNGYNNSRFFGNLYAEVNILSSLKAKSLFGYDYATDRYNYFLDPFKTDFGRVNNGLANLNMNQNAYWLNENTLTYKKFIGKHSIEAFGGFSMSRSSYEGSAIETKNFSSSTVTTVNGGSIINSATGSRTARTNQAIIGRVNYAFDDKYLFTGNFRADASSVFGPDNRWGYFPSFSVGWRLSQENFLKDVSFLSDLKIRYGWGKVGNDRIAPYSYFGQVGVGYNYVLGGNLSSGTGPNTPENRDLKWETTIQNNLGIDISLFNSRVNLSVDAYKKQTRDLLFDKPVALSSGFSGALQNVGNLQNKGIEFALNTKNLVNDLKWETSLNLSINRNKVGYIADQVLPVGAIYQREEAAIIKEGYPLGTFFGYVAKGVDPQTGMEQYEDFDNNGILNNDDKRVIGNANPKFTYGITNFLSYKNFNINIFFQGVQGNQIFNATRIETEGLNDFRNQSSAVLNRWTTPGQITNIPKAVADDVSNTRISSRFIENGSYLRLKSLTLGYSFSPTIVKKLGIQKLGLYVTGENVFTSSKYSGFDPEVSAFAGQNGVSGIDYGTYPQVRAFIVGLNVSL
ncbi:SusC/RagA family TonB-linked outer membrane protein [Mucilaginibacter conchicola]|uniref:SusC/RagA family TonB-linked outer membrane protein n=1 Tax=Mucilaginibacter conchicola TaxID=2303333 RepID=A0A372NSS4_9SPHI|nr:TonB-dependent receptor [Mucilaginibacter conchicola]RFZ92333.1 SusC/RagA family TonB-linked outer membrane protein [Mucilaginibacter conchicola]